MPFHGFPVMQPVDLFCQKISYPYFFTAVKFTAVAKMGNNLGKPINIYIGPSSNVSDNDFAFFDINDSSILRHFSRLS